MKYKDLDHILTDIDECALDTDKCEQLCYNNLGSYRCGCRDGFLLNTTTRQSCYGR